MNNTPICIEIRVLCSSCSRPPPPPPPHAAWCTHKYTSVDTMHGNTRRGCVSDTRHARYPPSRKTRYAEPRIRTRLPIAGRLRILIGRHLGGIIATTFSPTRRLAKFTGRGKKRLIASLATSARTYRTKLWTSGGEFRPGANV